MIKKYNKLLVTGGAGFVGSFLVDKLVEKGYKVKIFDNLEDQIHRGKKPRYLNRSAQFIKGDVRDYQIFPKIIREKKFSYFINKLKSKKKIGNAIGWDKNE